MQTFNFSEPAYVFVDMVYVPYLALLEAAH